MSKKNIKALTWIDKHRLLFVFGVIILFVLIVGAFSGNKPGANTVTSVDKSIDTSTIAKPTEKSTPAPAEPAPEPEVVTAPITEPEPAPVPVKTSPPTSPNSYQSIYDRYSARLRSECPNLSMMECATVSSEGITKMAEYMLSASGTDGQQATYSDWASKLQAVYMAEAR
ncbi:MAG: hypothetical protein WCP11_02280 [Candidatus Saccharibacteria bacterium]